MIMIDESIFGLHKRRVKNWQHKEIPFDFCNNKELRTINITLLLAISPTGILDYFIVFGAVNDLIFVDFLNTIYERIIKESENKNDFILLFDNSKPHKTQLIQNFLLKHDIRAVYSPANSPEILFIENIFNRLKRYYFKENSKKSMSVN